MPKLSLRHISKRFGKLVIIDKVSFDVYDGEIFGIVGPNGCGKTTLLKLIAGLIKPDEGEIMIDGVKVTHLGPKDRGIRMFFQNYALYPHMKVYEEQRYSNLSFPLRIKKIFGERLRKRVFEVSKRVGIDEGLFLRYPNELSSGQQQRVALGRAITIVPRIFLLDEPLAHLDPLIKLKVRDEIKKLHGELKSTTIYVTNDLPEAFYMADRLAVMGEGKIHQIATPKDIYNYPANEFVRAFIHSYDFFVKGR
ncbi:MAG: ABC transporter ATP-binding protein [Nitrososphaerales archaeon]